MFDARWRWAFTTDELRDSYGDSGATTVLPIGSHFFSPECMEFARAQVGRSWTAPEGRQDWFLTLGRYVLATTPGGRDELRGLVAPEFAGLVDDLQPLDAPLVWVDRPEWTAGGSGVTGDESFFNVIQLYR